MTPVNDEYAPESELLQLTGQARFLICAIANYEGEPSEDAWAIVTDGMQALRETTGSIWERYVVRNGALTEPENTTASSV